MATKIPLSLYLLKADVTPADAVALAIARSGAAEDPFPDEQDDAVLPQAWIRSFRWVGDAPVPAELSDDRSESPSLLVRASRSEAGWRGLIGDLMPSGAEASDLTASTVQYGALLFQPVRHHLVVWTFGNAWSLLDMSKVVDRFGLRVGLNALVSSPAPATGPAKDVGVRNLTSAVRATTVRRAALATVRPSSPREMERLDPSTDAASMAELTTHHPLFGSVSAGKSIRFQSSARGLRDLRYAAIQALRLHRRRDYAVDPDYQWIDNATPVGDEAVVNGVLGQLWTDATAVPPSAVVDVLWADEDPDTHIQPSTVRFHGERGPTGRTTVTWPAIQAWFRGQHPSVVGSAALRTHLRFFDGNQQVAENPLWTHLVAQVAVGGLTYLVSDGEVWQYSPTYLTELDKRLAQYTDTTAAHLPRYLPGESEGAYNTRAANQPGFVLLDKALLRPTNQSPVEAGDLLSRSGQLMHVKRRARSSTMSYVANQALGAVQLLRSDAESRKLLDTVLLRASPAPAGLRAMQQHCASFATNATVEVQLVIIGDWQGTPSVSQLPLLTRLAFDSWLRQMPCNRRIVLVGT